MTPYTLENGGKCLGLEVKGKILSQLKGV